jgi:hypothetical protein
MTKLEHIKIDSGTFCRLLSFELDFPDLSSMNSDTDETSDAIGIGTVQEVELLVGVLDTVRYTAWRTLSPQHRKQYSQIHCNLRWYRKFETIAKWREEPAKAMGDVRELLIAALNVVREADHRPSLTPEERAAIPSSVPLVRMLLDIFARPYTWSALKHSEMLELHADLGDIDEIDEGKKAASPEGEEESDLAQFYIRRLVFTDFEALKKLLEGIKLVKPHYSGHIEGLIKESSKFCTNTSDQLHLSYAGFTVANTPVGRQLDDGQEASDWAFLKTVLKAFDGKVLIYEVPALRFKVGKGGHESVMDSRMDIRTNLFESLLIDSHGFNCLNTAPAGTTRKVAISTPDLALNEKIRSETYLTQDFSFLS